MSARFICPHCHSPLDPQTIETATSDDSQWRICPDCDAPIVQLYGAQEAVAQRRSAVQAIAPKRGAAAARSRREGAAPLPGSGAR